MPAKRIKPKVADVRLPHEPSPFEAKEGTIIATVAEKLAAGIPLAHICRAEGMPTPRTIQLWCEANPAFASLIARGRLDGHDLISADCLSIGDEVDPKPAAVMKARLQIETRLKLLAKWDPKRYGDKLAVENSGSMEHRHTITEERLKELQAKKQRAIALLDDSGRN